MEHREDYIYENPNKNKQFEENNNKLVRGCSWEHNLYF